MDVRSTVSKVFESSWTILFPLLPTSVMPNSTNVRPFLSEHSTQVLVHALVTSCLDYCIAFISGPPPKPLLNPFQMVQNSAWVITLIKSITPIHIQLHWLPIPLCIQYKISLLTFLLLSKALSTPVTFRPHSSHPSQQLQLLFWLLLTSGIMGAFNCAAPLQLITTSPLSARLYDVIQIETQKQ